MSSALNVVLYRPEIPYNTGSTIRLCAAFNARLHLIRPYGFFLGHKEMKRASVGYLDKIDLIEHDTFGDFLETVAPARIYAFTKKATTAINEVNLGFSDEKPLYLLFGNETDGLPGFALEASNTSVRIPIASGVRCLNLASTVACALYESRRALKFQGLEISGAAAK